MLRPLLSTPDNTSIPRLCHWIMFYIYIIFIFVALKVKILFCLSVGKASRAVERLLCLMVLMDNYIKTNHHENVNTIPTTPGTMLYSWGYTRVFCGNKRSPNLSGLRQKSLLLSHTEFAVQNFPRQLSSMCWLNTGYLNPMALPYQHTLPQSPGAGWELDGPTLTVTCAWPCPVHNALVRTSHKTPPRGSWVRNFNSSICQEGEKIR